MVLPSHILTDMRTITTEKLRERVCRVYSQAARKPTEEQIFPLGRDFAASLGYPPDLLSALPAVSIDAFTGVSNVSVFADLPNGAQVCWMWVVAPASIH
jgi:hypothetical protein